MIEKVFHSLKGCVADVHVEAEPFNNGKKIVITILKNGEIVDSYSTNEEPSRKSFDSIGWFFSKYGADCYETIRTWWLNDAFPKLQRTVIERNRVTTPSERTLFKHRFRYSK